MSKITIVETGLVSPERRAWHGSFPQMFERLIGEADASASFATVRLIDGERLPDPAGLEAILITGSSAGVYDISTGSRRSSALYGRRMKREFQWSESALAIN